MMSVPAIRPTTNPYISQLVAQVSALCDVRLFSWRGALLGRYDVFHVHWPEVLMRGRSPLRTWLRRTLSWLLLLRFSLTRTAVVRTLHNATPHEATTRAERRLLRMWDARTSAWILLSEHGSADVTGVQTVILHGHYRDLYADLARRAPEAGVVGVVGLIRPYKGTEELVSTVLEDPGPADYSLRIAGSPSDDEIRERLTTLAAASERIELELAFLDEKRLVEVITSSSVIALPYRQMLNSGIALLALSLDRPILIPDNPTNRALRDEVGPEWVHLFEGRVRPDDIRGVLARGIPEGRPALESREWRSGAARHITAYESAVAARRRTNDE